MVTTKDLSHERLDQFDRAHGYLTQVKQIRQNSLILLIGNRSNLNVPGVQFINKVMTGAQPPLLIPALSQTSTIVCSFLYILETHCKRKTSS